MSSIREPSPFTEAPPRAIDLPEKQRLTQWYDSLAESRQRFLKRNRYYHSVIARHYRQIIPPGATVLEVGCGDGSLLSALKPAHGVGIDISSGMVRMAATSHLHNRHLKFFQADVERITFKEQFDYVILSDVIGILRDIQTTLDNIRSACRPETRVILNYHNMLWEPLLKVVERMGWKMPQLWHNWLSRSDIDNFIALSDFETIEYRREILMPLGVAVLSNLINNHVARIPGLNALTLSTFAVLRKREKTGSRSLSTSIVIPCRNERENIRAAIERLPDFGTTQEIIFVDGKSTDGTAQRIAELQDEFPEKRIRLYHQQGSGKGDAVRLGFERATGDVLMILDADLTVPPEELPKFYHAIATGKGEFVAGSRLVYPMEKQAMRFLNILGNKAFSILFSWLFNRRIKDTLCGTKVLLRADYERLMKTDAADFGRHDPFGDFHLLLGAFRLNLKYLEIPVIYRERRYGVTNIRRFYHGFQLAKVVWSAYRWIRR